MLHIYVRGALAATVLSLAAPACSVGTLKCGPTQSMFRATALLWSGTGVSGSAASTDRPCDFDVGQFFCADDLADARAKVQAMVDGAAEAGGSALDGTVVAWTVIDTDLAGGPALTPVSGERHPFGTGFVLLGGAAVEGYSCQSGVPAGSTVKTVDNGAGVSCSGLGGENPCQECAANKCCGEWQACELDSACQCWIACEADGFAADDCEMPPGTDLAVPSCGPRSDVAEATDECLVSSCTSTCGAKLHGTAVGASFLGLLEHGEGVCK